MTENYNKEEIIKYVEETDGVVLYFYSEQCVACQPLRKKIKQWVEKNYPKLNLLFINAVENPDITAYFSIFSNPTILVFLGGKEVMREGSFLSEKVFSDKVNRLYHLLFDE